MGEGRKSPEVHTIHIAVISKIVQEVRGSRIGIEQRLQILITEIIQNKHDHILIRRYGKLFFTGKMPVSLLPHISGILSGK